MPSGEYDHMSEKLSALIDNELDDLERERALKELGRDSELVEAWSRYHIIGLAMRGDQVSPGVDLADRVAQHLHSETAPAPGSRGERSRGAWLGSAGNLALAASMAVVLVAGGVILGLQDERPARNVASGADARVMFADEATRWDGADPGAEDALNALLIEHGEFTSASGMNGLTAYTKFVAYDSR